ncbi:ABC transporter substrate-binding protein [Halomarina ordinaria]|uniref:ABC transporter substrate-binding protein n=1 Tax=Halomarina ordinaria TaxID=3033939 RepID=A0ABD5U9F6_9EURY|nr:ABC transporter substrate-binding protein [Halomarina sp. PSRA2]
MPTGDKYDRRTFLKAAGATAAAATLAGCAGGDSPGAGGGDGNGSGNGSGGGGGGGEGGRLAYARGNDSATLDPQSTTSGEDAKVINQVYDTLIKFEPGESTLVEGLATDFSLDGTTASLTLREDATFHGDDGATFTADDFVATYRRFVDEEYDYFIGTSDDEGVEGSAQSFYGPYLLDKVENVEATSETELTLELDSEYAPFLRNLAVFAMAVMPKNLIEEGHDFSGEPVGTGAFAFEEWDTGNQRIMLSGNDDFWGEGPYVDEVVFQGVGQNSTRAQSLLAGEVQLIDGIGAQEVSQIQNSEDAELQETPGMTVGYMAFNMARVEAFRDKNVRQAISHAINVEAIIENIYEGLAVQASHPLPETVMGHNGDVEPYEYDPETAQQLLEEAGYGDGFSFELATMNNPRPYFASPQQTAEVVRSNLEEVGIEVEINEQSWDPFLNYTSEGQHDACFLGWISDNADPDNFYYPLLHPQVDASEVPDGQDWVSRDVEGFNTGNRAAWANTDFMDLVEQGQAEYDEGAREEIYLEASQLVHDEAPWVFMTHTSEMRGVGAGVSGFTVSPIGGPALHLVELS